MPFLETTDEDDGNVVYICTEIPYVRQCGGPQEVGGDLHFGPPTENVTGFLVLPRYWKGLTQLKDHSHDQYGSSRSMSHASQLFYSFIEITTQQMLEPSL